MGVHNLSENTIIELFRREPIDIWINSFGGCRSNYIRDCIKDSYTTYNTAYEMKACHYVRPLDVSVGSGIFCYTEDVGIAISSQIKRGMYHNFQKLMEGDNEVPFSIDTWLDSIDRQIDNWTNNPYFPTIIINTDVVGDYKSQFEEVYEVEMLPFKPRTTSEYIDEVKPYTEKINKLNEKLKKLPDFAVHKPNNIH
jgi:hypothetical protein